MEDIGSIEDELKLLSKKRIISFNKFSKKYIKKM